MISRITRGSDTSGLLLYLLGPGRSNEHTDPHLVASWDEDPGALEPATVNGRPQVRALAALLDQPLDASPRRPARTVWHCSLRNAPSDRRLSDQEWAEAARRVLDRVGLASPDDSGGCRWVAVRHGEDHIHLLVTLARQDVTSVRTPNDYRLAGQACQELERRFALIPTRARDSTAVPRSSRAEVEKAQRSGRGEATRETLRREVRLASSAALDPQTFLAELQRNGLLIKPRYSAVDPALLTGYAVAWPGDHAPSGRPVWFSGSILAPDLSLPRLRQRWEIVGDEVARLRVPNHSHLQHRVDWAPVVRALTSAIGLTGGRGRAAGLVHATASTLLAVARALEGRRGGALTSSSDNLMKTCGRAGGLLTAESEHVGRLLAAAHIALRPSGDRRAGIAGPRVSSRSWWNSSGCSPDSRGTVRSHHCGQQLR